VDGRLILVDLLAGRLLETGGDEPGPLRELRRLDAPLGAVAPVAGAAGNWLAAVGTGVALLSGTDGYRQVADLGSGNPVPARMNDAVADPTAAWSASCGCRWPSPPASASAAHSCGGSHHQRPLRAGRTGPAGWRPARSRHRRCWDARPCG
jgi:hypothetical protein